MLLKDCYIGQVVQFRDLYTLLNLTNKNKVQFGFNEKMGHLCGRQLTIKKIDGDGRIWFKEQGNDFYMAPGQPWWFSADMIEEIVNEEAIDEISGDDELLQMLLS